MTKAKKPLLVSAIIAIAVAAMLLAGGYLLTRLSASNYTQTLQANWEIRLPSSCTLIYNTDSGASSHGDGRRYHVYTCMDEDALTQALAWESEQSATLFCDSYADAVTAWLEAISAEDAQYPDFSRCVYYYLASEDSSELIVLWDCGSQTVYVAESIL